MKMYTAFDTYLTFKLLGVRSYEIGSDMKGWAIEQDAILNDMRRLKPLSYFNRLSLWRTIGKDSYYDYEWISVKDFYKLNLTKEAQSKRNLTK